MLQDVPLSREKIQALGLRRFTASDRSFSLIVPGSWRKLPPKKRQPLILKETGSSSVNSELVLTRFPMSREFAQKHPGTSAMEYYYRGVTTQERKNKTVVKALKTLRLPDRIYGVYIVKNSVQGKEIYQYHSLMQSGGVLYDLALFSDKANIDTAGFLSRLGIYSLWTPEECRRPVSDSR